MSYRVVIRKNETGEVRTTTPYDLEYHEFWWSEGNMACDCNRYREFERASPAPRPADDPHLNNLPGVDCSEGKYTVLEIIHETGRREKFNA